ncbi:uncharacterized protein TrAFT101_005721 [Trichoderma asperellum]|uniref:uncharacterized protein n=1 Tax=Trichoderma asperellum TaxID=101201 RepID=UPI00331FD7FA|nr:hypothetical protein TrAFT101_005721 [Trichoderma asperellum]
MTRYLGRHLQLLYINRLWFKKACSTFYIQLKRNGSDLKGKNSLPRISSVTRFLPNSFQLTALSRNAAIDFNLHKHMSIRHSDDAMLGQLRNASTP